MKEIGQSLWQKALVLNLKTIAKGFSLLCLFSLFVYCRISYHVTLPWRIAYLNANQISVRMNE